MNTYKKYCPNVYVAQCTEKHQKGETIILTTKYGKENECIVHNLVGEIKTDSGVKYLYSITRKDGYNNQVRAKNKAEKLKGYSNSAKKRGEEWIEKSNEGRDFLVLGEPIKKGHHSERRHRALIERNNKRMENAIKELEKSEQYANKIEYWEKMANKIDLSNPESIEYFTYKLEKAKEYHKFIKENPDKRPHSYSLTYANKDVKELTKKLDIANKLWG